VKIYTMQGDQGMSSLFGGTKVAKDHPRLIAYGTVDELNSCLGLAMVTCQHGALKVQLESLQHELFQLGADLATPLGSSLESRVHRIGQPEVTALEKQIDAATEQLAPLKQFILPGGGETAARLHVARSVCRRAERDVVTLMKMPSDPIGPHILIFMNRFSDLLFVLARLANKLDGTVDVAWTKK